MKENDVVVLAQGSMARLVPTNLSTACARTLESTFERRGIEGAARPSTMPGIICSGSMGLDTQVYPVRHLGWVNAAW